MQSYLGIDAGGSGSRWALVDERGDVLAEGADGPSIQVAECGVATAAQRVAALMERVAARHPEGGEAPVVVGLAGIAAAEGKAALTAALAGLAKGRRIRLVEDTVTGAAAALADRPGVALFAGTGSFAIARSASGALSRVGGRGSVASDFGSGYRLVVAAAAAALRAHDGMAPPTALGSRLTTAFGVSHLDDLGVALKRATTKDIAAAAPAVLACAEGGDAVSTALVGEAAGDLADLAEAAAHRAGLAPASCSVLLGGGTMRADFYADQTAAACRARGFVEVRPIPVPAAVGAAWLARAEARGEQPLAGWLDG